MEFGYPKKMRLCSRRDISALFEGGKILYEYPYKIYYYEKADAEISRFVISVPKKCFKRAVKRNLLKRRTREVIRLNQHILGDFKGDFLLVYLSKDIYKSSDLLTKISSSFAKIVAKNQECGDISTTTDNQDI
jgi:ribonuclease P protein component